MKTMTFTSKKTNTYTFPFNKKYTYEPNYSEILDDIILADVIDKNKYLFTSGTTYIPLTSSTLKGDDKFIKAANFLANYKKNKSYFKNIPFKLNKTYKLSNGTPIIFYDDEIQIGFDIYKYSDFSNLSFLNGITDNTKNIIINIYTTGSANIDINIL